MDKAIFLFFYVLLFFSFVSAQNLPVPMPQNPAFIYSSPAINYYSYGSSFEAVGDLNSDNYQEFIVATVDFNDLNSYNSGPIYLIDGKSGNRVNTYYPPACGNGPCPGSNQYQAFGWDMEILKNSLGIDRLLVSQQGGSTIPANNNGFIYSYDISTNQIYFQLGPGVVMPVPTLTGSCVLGRHLSNLGDINADSVDDFASSILCFAPTYNQYIRIFSGADGSTLNTINFLSMPVAAITSIKSLGDITGDGFSDFAVNAFAAGSAVGVSNAGSVFIYSGGTNPVQINRLDGSFAGENFGFVVENIGDYNLDGFSDFAVSNSPANNGQATVNVFSGSNFAQIAQFSQVNPVNYNNFGSSIASGDFNRDGYRDIAIYARSALDSGQVYIYRGPSGSNLYTFIPQTINPQFFAFMRVFSVDINLDGFNDLIIPSFFIDPVSSLTSLPIYLYSYEGVWQYGQGSGLGINWIPNLINPGGPNPASGTFTINGASANSLGYLLISTSPASIPISQTNTFYVDPLTTAIYPFQFDSTGSITFSGISLYNANQQGSNLYFQFATQIPGSQSGQPMSYIFSKGVQIVLGA